MVFLSSAPIHIMEVALSPTYNSNPQNQAFLTHLLPLVSGFLLDELNARDEYPK